MTTEITIVAVDARTVTLRAGEVVAITTWPELHMAARQPGDDLAVPYALALVRATERYHGGPIAASVEAVRWLDWHEARVDPSCIADLQASGASREVVEQEARDFLDRVAAEKRAARPVRDELTRLVGPVEIAAKIATIRADLRDEERLARMRENEQAMRARLESAP